MVDEHKLYQEYLELYGYFGRDVPRLEPGEFRAHDRELAALVARAPDLELEDVRRVVALQTLLLRDRPTIEKLLAPRSRRRRPA